MEQGKLPKMTVLLRVPAGSDRYGLRVDDSDLDLFLLTPDINKKIFDPETNTAYFIWSFDRLRSYWGHPLIPGALTGECTGDERLCSFLRDHRWDLTYAAPERSARFGLEYIAQGELSGYDSPIKAGLRTAMILSHMAAGAEDPFLLSGEEKAALIRARNGVPAEERADIYRRTISPENIGRLMNLPEHPTIKNELFQLLEEVTSC